MQRFANPGRGNWLRAALVFALLLVGCSPVRSHSPAHGQGHMQASDVRLRVKGLPDGETYRRQVGNQLWIGYTDGRTEYRFLESDGTLSQSKITYPHTQVVARRVIFASDGKTVVQSDQYRQDRTLERSENVLSGGGKQIRIYWKDGVRLFALGVVKPGSPETQIQATFYREDGKAVLIRLVAEGKVSESIEQFDDKGVVQLRQLKTTSNTTVTVMQADGSTPNYQQIRTPNRPTELREFAADGKTLTRKILLTPSYAADYVEYYQGGVKTLVRTLGRDQLLKREEYFDSSGRVVKEVNYNSTSTAREKIDPQRLKLLEATDPFKYYQAHNK